MLSVFYLILSLNNNFSMRKVTLRFTDHRDLRRFVQVVSCNYLEINMKELTLICDCDESEIQLAEKGFSATLLSDEPTTSWFSFWIFITAFEMKARFVSIL